MVVAKSPIAIKSFLFQLAADSTDFQSFIKKAEEAAWIAFSEGTESRILEIEKIREKKGSEKQGSNWNARSRNFSKTSDQSTCKLHGLCMRTFHKRVPDPKKTPRKRHQV